MMDITPVAFEVPKMHSQRPQPVWPRRAEPPLHDLLRQGLQAAGHGSAVFDAGGHLVFANALGMGILGATPRFASEHASALRGACRDDARTLVEFHGPEGHGYAAIAPISVDGTVLALVTFGRAAPCGPLELRLYARLRGITPAELQVLEQLMRGLKATQIARLHGVAVSTVQTQVAALRAKTGSLSVKDLIARLSCLPAVPLRVLE